MGPRGLVLAVIDDLKSLRDADRGQEPTCWRAGLRNGSNGFAAVSEPRPWGSWYPTAFFSVLLEGRCDGILRFNQRSCNCSRDHVFLPSRPWDSSLNCRNRARARFARALRGGACAERDLLHTHSV